MDTSGRVRGSQVMWREALRPCNICGAAQPRHPADLVEPQSKKPYRTWPLRKLSADSQMKRMYTPRCGLAVGCVLGGFHG